MKTFTIDENNNITTFPTQKEAAGAAGLAFSSQKELAKISAEWSIGRFIEIWNGFAGVPPFGDLKPVKKFTDRTTAVARIWQTIQRLDAALPTSVREEELNPEPEVLAVAENAPPEPVAEVPAQEAAPVAPPDSEAAPEAPRVHESDATAELAPVAPQVPDSAPVEAAANPEPAAADNAPVAEQPAPKPPKRRKAAKPEKEAAAAGPREGSKTARVVAMLQRDGGATITEIMTTMRWQKHTVRGFMAGAMKKAGYAVESFKPEGGERSYRIPSK